VFAFLTDEATQGMDLDGDGDQVDRVLQVYDPATNQLVNTGQSARDFVCNAYVLALRTNEHDQGDLINVHLQGGVDPPDTATDVLQAYDLSRPECLTAAHPADCVVNSKQSVRPCQLDACDPHFPYRVIGQTVRFLTFECDQRGNVTNGCPTGGTDLDGEVPPDANELILQQFDVKRRTTTVIGVAGNEPGDPTKEPTTV